ncbi:hypothetical protein D9758_017275 [Tetrapyrgos nigripes]|uniref:Uncharacterized protein n=1 Tax=Tetrapyrgos nigripes TaxID=182062 RepID=A0A8H5C2T8_9AGAR|nr:hypothetical protein D9758_017275 [Tetrapyrgos nigripes]
MEDYGTEPETEGEGNGRRPRHQCIDIHVNFDVSLHIPPQKKVPNPPFKKTKTYYKALGSEDAYSPNTHHMRFLTNDFSLNKFLPKSALEHKEGTP